MVAGALATPPMATTTGSVPSGAVAGMRRLICATPTKVVGIPSNRMEPAPVATPPIETVVACMGTGNSPTGVPAAGAAPVAMAGETAPTPVRYRVNTAPRATVAVGTTAPPASVNRPGAAEATVSVVLEMRPLLLTATMEARFRGV